MSGIDFCGVCKRLALFFFSFALLTSTAIAQTTTVTPNQPELWTTANDAGSGNTVISTANPPPGNTASLSFEGMDSSDDRAEARRVLGRSLTSITGIGYSYWTDTTDGTRQPSLKLEFFSALRSGTLTWIPANNGGVLNSWVTVDGTTGLWFSSENSSLQTLADHQADLGDVLVNYIRVGTSSGSNAPLNEGYADLVTVTTSGLGGGTRTWDFESASTEPLPPPQVITVTPTAPELWSNANDAGTGMSSISTAQPRGVSGSPTGSIAFEGMDSSDDRAEFRRPFGRSLLSIIGIGYDYWTDSTDGNRQPSLKIEFFGARSGTLTYIPADNGAVPLNAWNRVDATNGLWRSSENNTTQTLAAHQADLGNVLANFIRVGTSAGSSAPLTLGYGDLVFVSTPETGTRVWDFEDEPLPPLPPQEVITVDPTNTAGWLPTDQSGSATVELTATQPRGPGNTGSLEFTTSGDPSDQVNGSRIPLISVSDIREIGYDYYTNSATLAPSLKLQYFSLTRFGTLVYEPINQGTYPVNAWNAVDGTAGVWWSTEFGQIDKRTLAEWQQELGDILVNFLQVGVGSGWASASSSFADQVYLATSASNTLWDFEPAPAPAETITTITSSVPNPSIVGNVVAVNFTVTSLAGTPTGTVEVSDGVTSCTASVAVGTCDLNFATAGAKTLVAEYTSDSASFADSVSAGFAHQVNELVAPVPTPTTTTIAASVPNPSFVGDVVAVNFSVTAVAGTPTGTVEVSDGVTSCIASAASGTCNLTFVSAGAKSLVATFTSDDIGFANSVSAPYAHQVDVLNAPTPTQTTITGSAPNPSEIGQSVLVSYRVSGTTRGVPTGNVTVTDGTVSCTDTVAAGGCSLVFTTAGNKSLVASYSGDSAPSSSPPFDHLVNGPVGAPTPPEAIPTLPAWALVMLSLLLGGVAWQGVRLQGRTGRGNQT